MLCFLMHTILFLFVVQMQHLTLLDILVIFLGINLKTLLIRSVELYYNSYISGITGLDYYLPFCNSAVQDVGTADVQSSLSYDS